MEDVLERPSADVAFLAIVQAVVDGKHGLYAIAEVQTMGSEPPFEGSVTFSLARGVWGEKDVPQAGEYVVLTRLRRKRAGWRAMKARFQNEKDIVFNQRKE